jgi:EAL domain-containing protein (putative c-di-GMP-specific phosphodiesterase class I)
MFVGASGMRGGLLEEILSPNGLSVLVQPIIRVSSRKRSLHGVECLSRGPKATLFERPDVLFDYVRRKKAELVVDRKVIELALQACSPIPDPIRVSVNVHASSLGRDRGFASYLQQHAANTGIRMSRITVEIVEHAPMWNKPQFLETVADLQRLGVLIALDDVGSGQSNYHMILDAAPNCFKVDAFIVRDVHSDLRRRAILASVVKLASELGSTVVAEGVENELDLAALTELGIAFMQGYLFSRPVTVEELLRSSWIQPATLAAGAGI